jgi:hypothetical protein
VRHHADAGKRQTVVRELHHRSEIRKAVIVLTQCDAFARFTRAEAPIDLNLERAIAPEAEFLRGEQEGVATMRYPRQTEGHLRGCCKGSARAEECRCRDRRRTKAGGERPTRNYALHEIPPLSWVEQ